MKHKMTMTTKTHLVCIAAAAFAGSANAATLANIGTAWPGTPALPDPPALQVISNTQDNNGRGITEARGEFIQTFTTTTAFQIDKIYIEASGIVASREFQLRVFETA
jgi:hypothetical protein